MAEGNGVAGGLARAAGVAWAAIWRFDRHDGYAMAGYVAFQAFLSLFPSAIFITTLAGMLIGPEQSVFVIDQMFELVPGHVAQTLEPALRDVLDRDRGGLLTISGLIAVIVASNAIEAVRSSFDRAYEATLLGSFIKRRLVSVLFVFIAGFVFATLGIVLIAAPLAIDLAERLFGIEFPTGITLGRYVFGVAAFAGFLLALNRWLPSIELKTKWLAPGILVTTALWIASAAGFSIYLQYAPNYTVTYGTFAGVIITLIFFYLTSAAIIYGAEVNAVLRAEREAGVEGAKDQWRRWR